MDQPHASDDAVARRSSGSARSVPWIFVGLVLFSAAFYAKTASFDFVDFDDRRVLLAHENLYAAETFGESLREIFVDYFPREEPLLVRDVSWAVDTRIFGFENPRGYHIGNILFNALVVGMLFLLLRRTTGNTLVAAGTALAFAVAPTHAEPVAWVMGRKDLLAALFMLIGLWAQSVELSSERRSARVAWWFLALVCCLLALGSKISAVAFVAVLALHRVFFPYLEGRLAPDAPFDIVGTIRRLPALVPHAIVTGAVFVWYRGILSDYGILRSTGPGPLDPVHLGHVFQFFPLLLGEYLSHTIWPTDLSMFYRWPHVEVPLTAGETVASVALALGVIAALVYAIAKRRDLAFYVLFALALLMPYCGLFYVGFWHADRYWYLASAGLLAVAAIVISELATRHPRVRAGFAALAAAFVLSSGLLAWQQQDVWRDDEALWSYEANREEPSLLSIQALAKYYVRQAEAAQDPAARNEWIRKATAQIERGLARDAAMGRVSGPYKVPEIKHLARIHVLRGRVAGMVGAPPPVQAEHFRRAFELAPERPQRDSPVPQPLPVRRRGSGGPTTALGRSLVRLLRPLHRAFVSRPAAPRGQPRSPRCELRGTLPVPRAPRRRGAQDLVPMSEGNAYVGAYPYLAERGRVWREIVRYVRRDAGEVDTLVELGAGFCDFVNQFPAKHKIVYDLNPEMQVMAADDVDWILGDAQQIASLPAGSVDLVFASNFLEHLEGDAVDELLEACHRTLRPGGRLMLIQPNHRRCADRYFDDPTHVTVFDDENIGPWIARAGFKIRRLEPGLLPFSMKSSAPKWPLLVRAYLHSPVRPLAAQMYVVAERD